MKEIYFHERSSPKLQECLMLSLEVVQRLHGAEVFASRHWIKLVLLTRVKWNMEVVVGVKDESWEVLGEVRKPPTNMGELGKVSQWDRPTHTKKLLGIYRTSTAESTPLKDAKQEK